MSLSLTPRCPVCSGTENLRRCQGCEVQAYCSRDHQVADCDTHEVACNGVNKAQENLEEDEAALRAKPPYSGLPPNVFEEEVGHFCGILATQDYMRARYGLVKLY